MALPEQVVSRGVDQDRQKYRGGEATACGFDRLRAAGEVAEVELPVPVFFEQLVGVVRHLSTS